MTSHARRKKVEQMWRQISEALEDSLPEGMLAATAANQQKGQIRFRLLRSVSKLTYVKQVSQEDTAEIRADIMLCATTGWLSDETAKDLLDGLDELEGEI